MFPFKEYIVWHYSIYGVFIAVNMAGVIGTGRKWRCTGRFWVTA
jgi:hypothetical protein